MIAAGAVLASGCRNASRDVPLVDASATPVTFAKRPRAVGDRYEETVATTMTLSLHGGRTTDTVIRHEATRSEEVLAIADDAVTKMRLKLGDVVERATHAGKEAVTSSPIAGKTYIVEAKDGAREVRSEDGTPVPHTERSAVEMLTASLGRADPIAAALPATPLAPGKSVDGLATAIGARMREDGVGVSDVSVTFDGARGDDGVFRITMKLSKGDGATPMTMLLTGEARISTRTGRLVKIELKGPIQLRRPNVEGSGTMSMSIEARAL